VSLGYPPSGLCGSGCGAVHRGKPGGGIGVGAGVGAGFERRRLLDLPDEPLMCSSSTSTASTTGATRIMVREREGGSFGVKRFRPEFFAASLSAKNVSENERENPSEHRPSHEEVALDRRDHVVLDSPQLSCHVLVGFDAPSSERRGARARPHHRRHMPNVTGPK
jgi:hypothetical protein